MSDKPDLSELFQMLAEEKAKASDKQKQKNKKPKEYRKDFMEKFSLELKKLKQEEEQHKRDIAAMEAWLTSPVVEKDEKPELEVEVTNESVASSEPVTEEEIEAVEQVLEEDKKILEALAETPLQEQALQYLNDKREELSEEAQQIKSIKKEMGSFSDQLTKLRLLLQNVGGGGIVKLSQADDIDKSTALVNNKYLKYDSTTGKFVGADASGGAVDLSAVDQNIVPATTETYDLGSSSLRWNELFLAGQTIDLGGTKITKDSNGDVELKDSGDNLKKIIVDELQIGTGANKLKIQRGSDGKLKALDNSDNKASHDVAFSEISGTPTTLAGYGITDAFDGAYSSLTGAPTIPSDVNDLTDADSLLGGGGIALTALSVNPVEGTASGDGGLAYDNLTGVFTYTPPDLSSYLTSYTVTESDVTTHQAALSITESQISDFGSYATLASPTLTGTPAAPTAATGTDTTQIATTAFVQQEITALKALLYAYDQS